MPAFSFKERFIPLLKDGSKCQTIRLKRKGQAKPGDTIYLYYGLRTKSCIKIGEGICTMVEDIHISPSGIITVNGLKLNMAQKNELAWNDGFRDDSGNKGKSFEIMMRWWKQTHDLPFEGDLISWVKK